MKYNNRSMNKKSYNRRTIRKDYRIRKDELNQKYKQNKNNSDSNNNGLFRQEHKDIKEQIKNEYKEQILEMKYIKQVSLKNVKGRIKNNMSGILRGLIIGILILLQFSVIICLPLVLRQYSAVFYLILEICSFFVAVGLTNASKNSSYKIAWLSIALLLPVSGHIMYYLWGRKKTRKKVFDRAAEKIAESYPYYSVDHNVIKRLVDIEPCTGKLTKYISNQNIPLYSNTSMKYYSMGEDVFDDLFEDLMRAKKFIFVNFFIVAEGALWDTLHQILLSKVKEGVEVTFIYDDFGGMLRTNKHFADNLNKEGIRTIVFNPIKRYTDKVIMNYRSHQKIVVIDGKIGYTGGINIADEYANLVERFGTWKDCGIRLEGEGVWGLSITFMQMWSICCPQEHISYMKYKSEKKMSDNANNESFCHVLADGPVISKDNIIENVYKQIIATADKYVYIMTPYLALDEIMTSTILEAVKRGVDIRIITPNIPDKKTVKLLTNYNYGILLENGVRIYEYTPGFIHSKVIMNEFCAVVGTVNMDYRSFYLHYENAVWLYNTKVLGDIHSDFADTFEISDEYTYERWLERPFAHRVIQPVINLFATLL